MKALPKAIGTLVLVLFGTLASASAMAQHHGHGHAHGGNVRFGITFGVPLYGPGYYPAPYYRYPATVYSYPAPVYTYPAPVYTYPGAVIGSYSPPVYVERGTNQAAPAHAQGDWYYCAATKSYYPYVGECASGWQRVPAQPSAR